MVFVFSLHLQNFTLDDDGCTLLWFMSSDLLIFLLLFFNVP